MAPHTEDVLSKEAQRLLSAMIPHIPANLATYTGAISAQLAQKQAPKSEWVEVLAPLVNLVEGVTKSPDQIAEALATGLAGYTVQQEIVIKEEVDPSVLVKIDPLTLGFMGKILLLRAKLILNKGHKYGVVGENGAGKTTLMRKMAAAELPGFPPNLKIMYVQPDFGTDKADLLPLDYLKVAMAEGKKPIDESRCKEILSELSFTSKQLDLPAGELSGGWQMRLSLARASLFTNELDLLLLDEPTNHLDNIAVDWLVRFLQSVKCTAIIISHEPAFLDKVVTDILFMAGKKLSFYEGNFSNFTQSQGTFTVKDLEESAKRPEGDGLHFRFPDPGRLIGITSLKKTVLSMSNVVFKYPSAAKTSPPTLNGLDVRLNLASRVAIVGPNGSGKTTLVKLLVGELDLEDGSKWRHHDLRVAYVGQHSLDHLDAVKEKPAIRYIQQRFRKGYDSESAAFKPIDENEELATSNSQDHRIGEVEEILGRRKFKNKLAYEVKWKNKQYTSNTWETAMVLKELGAYNLVLQCDEKIRSKKSGLDQRPLTTNEVMRHLMDFGLDEQYANSKIASLSGGQKSKLVLAGAMWLRPHMIVLDEPTNYLDLDALGALIKAINRFKGGVIVVSHNMEFLSQFCDETWKMEAGKLERIENIVVRKGQEEDEGSDQDEVVDMPRRTRQRSTRHSSTKQSVAVADGEQAVVQALELIDLDVLGELGLLAAAAKDRLKAVQELQESVEDGALLLEGGQPEAAKAVLQALIRFGLADKGDKAWKAAADAATALVVKHATDWGRDFLALLKTESLTAKMRMLKIAVRTAELKKKAPAPKPPAAAKAAAAVPAKRPVVYLHKFEDDEPKKPTEAPGEVVYDEHHDGSRNWGGILALTARLAAALGDKEEVAAAVDGILDACLNVGSMAGCSLPDGAGGFSKLSPVHQAHVHSGLAMALTSSVVVVPSLVDSVTAQCLACLAADAPKPFAQDGAAICLAGVVKASPRTAQALTKKLDELFESKSSKTAQQRIGVLLAYSQLFAQLGGLFEYLVVPFLPLLLAALGDRVPEVQRAARVCSRSVFSSLTTAGASMILPILLDSLKNAVDWKIKVPVVTLLGSMVHCSPELMARALPVVVPMLLDEMTSPQKVLSAAAVVSLEQIGGVVANPEIKPLLPVLMKALQNTFKETKPALEILSGVSFAHAIDPASLALIYPIVGNGLTHREAAARALALKVIAALASLVLSIDDILPYFSQLLTQLKVLMVHQSPAVRVEAAKALGAIYQEVNGDRHMPEMLPWLISVLDSPDSTDTQSSGAALGICHVLKGLPIKRTSELLPHFLAGLGNTSASVRVAFARLLEVIGEIVGPSFIHLHLDETLVGVLAALPDNTMKGAEAIMECAQRIVSVNTRAHQAALTPVLFAGLNSPNPSLRTKFLQLMGTLLLNLVTSTNFGMSIVFWGDGQKSRDGEVANQATKEQEQLLVNTFGAEAFENYFAKLYLLRCDNDDGVAAMAWRVWHLVIPSEVGLLIRLLETCVARVLLELQASDKERVGVGKRSMSDLVKRLGDDGLKKIVPLLDGRVKDPEPRVRLSVALGFGQVLHAANKNDIGQYLQDIVPTIALLLTDDSKEVRVCAGQSFGILVRNAGGKVIKRVLPGMVAQLSENVQAAGPSAKVVDQAALVDGLCLVLKNCDQELFFLLSSSLLTQIHAKNPSGDVATPMGQLREFIVVELAKVLKEQTKENGPKEVRTAARILHRFCEETPHSTAYLHHFIEHAVRRHKKAQREPLRLACVQLLIYAFGFQNDQAAGAQRLEAFFSDDARIEKDVLKADIYEYVKLCSSTPPESNLPHGEEEIPDDAPAEAKAAAAAVDVPIAATETTGVKKGLVIAPRQAIIPAGKVVGPKEKYCGRCDKVKPKTKFSKKQVKDLNGFCLLCGNE